MISPFLIPYSCINGTHGTVYNGASEVDPCDDVYFGSDFKMYINYGNTNIQSSFALGEDRIEVNNNNDIYDYKEALKHLFIKTSGVYNSSDGYDYTSSIPKCGTSGASSYFCATYPTVSDIKLLTNLGINMDVNSNNKFNVTRPGFYFITFNTTVDEDQVPISKLTIRMYKEGDDWTKSTGIKEFDNIDAKPNAADPHKIGVFLSVGTYDIMVKVKDNWTKYGCASRSGKDFGSVTTDCGKCCDDSENYDTTPFKDDTNSKCNLCF